MAKTIRYEQAEALLAEGRRVAAKLSELIDAGAIEPSFRRLLALTVATIVSARIAALPPTGSERQ